MDTVFCGHCKREQKLEDAAGSAVCTCKRCGALLQVPSLQVFYRSATPPVAQVLEAPRPEPQSDPPATSPKHKADSTEIRAPKYGVVSIRPVSQHPRSAARQNVDRRLQEEMEAYRPKATHSLSRDSLFANAPPSPVATTRVKTIDISGASTLRVPSGRAGNKGAVRENSVSLAPSEGEEKTRLTSPESSSVSLSFGPKVTPPPGSRTTAPPPSRVETFGADVIHTSAGPHVAVSAAASLSREPAGAVLSAGAIFHRRAPSTDSDGSSASAWRLRAFSAKPVTESDLPAGVNVYVAQPYVPDESEDDAPEFWAKPVDPPLGSQADLPPGAPVSAAQPNTPGEDKDGASEAWVKPVNSATPPEPWSERPPSTEPHNLQPFNSDLEMQKAREFGLAKSATPVAQQPNSPPPKTIYVAQSFVPVDIEDKTAEVSAKPAVPNPGFQANPNLGFEANPDLGVESSSDPWSELGAEKVWEENTFRDPGDGVAKRKAESSTPPTEAPSAAVRRITPSERNPKLEAPTPPPMFDEPHALAGTDLPSGAERVEPVVPQTLRQVNIGRTSGGEESGVPTTPPKASTPPSVSPTFQRAMLEYQKMKALFGPRSKSDPPKGGPENAASDRGVPDAEEGVGSDQEVFEEIDLDEGGGSKAETEGGGFKSGLKKWASGVEGMFRGVSVAKLSDASGASQSSENLHGRGVEEERAVGPDRLANAEQRSVAKAEKDQTTVDERALAVGTEGKEKGRKIVVPKGVEITVGKVTASGVASEPVRRAVSEPVVAAKGGPGSSTSRGVGKETSSGDVREWGESLKGLGTSANSGNNLVATGGSGSGSFRGGAEVGRSRNYGSTSSLGAWSDDSESELVRTVERLQLEEGGYVIRAVMKRVPKSGRSSPLLAGSRGTSPEPTFDGLQDDVALAGGVLRDDVAPEGEGLRGDVAPAGEGLRSDGATAEGGSRSDVALAQEGSRRDGRAPAMGDLQNDVALAGKDAQSDVTLSGQGLRASSGEVGRPEGAGEDAKSLQIPDALKKDLESEDGPETSGKLPGRDGVSGKGVLDQKRSEMDATTEGKVGASAKAAFKSAVLETSSGVGKRYEPAEEFPEGKEGSLERGKGERESADKAGGALQETPKAEPLLQATVSRIGSVGGTTVPGGSQPASETGSQDKAGPPETGAERATGATLLEAVAGGEARMTSPEAMLASPRRSGKFTGLSRVEVPAPAERSGPFPEAPKVTSARTKNVRLETRISAPGAMEARTTASSAVTPSPPNLEPGRTIEPVSAGAKLLPSSSLPALPPASALQPAFPNESRTPPLQTPVIPSLPRAFPYGDLYPFIGYTGEPYPKPELEPAPNRPLNPPDIQLPSPVQTTAKPLEGAPVFPVRQKPPTSPKLSISPPTEYVPWTGKSLSPTASAEPLPNVKLDIKPLSIDGHDAPQNPGSTPLSLGAEQTSSVNAPSDTVSGRPLDQVGASGSALTPEGLKKSVQSRRTPFRTSPQEVTSPKMTSPVSSEPASPAHRRSIDEARAGVETLKRSPRDSFEGNVAGSGSALRPPDKDADRSSLSKRGTVGENERNDRNERYERNDRNDRNERNERSERTDRKLAEGTWALGGAELAPPGAGNSEHTFSMWLDDDKKMPAAGRRSAIGVNTGAAPVRAFAQPVLGNTPAPGTFYRGPVGKGPNEAGDTSPGPKVHGRTDSDVSVRTSEFEGGISSFAGSEARLDSPPRSPEPKLPEFHPPEKFVALFGGSFTPPRSSLTRGSPPPGLPLPPGARPLPPVSKEPSFGDALRERRPHSSEPSPPQEGATREGSVPPDLHFWPPNEAPQVDVPTPPMPGRPSVLPPNRLPDPSPTNPLQTYNPLVYPSGSQPAALVIPNRGVIPNDPRGQSFASQSSTPSPGLPPGIRTGSADPFVGNPGVRNTGLGNPQLSFGSHSSGDRSQDSGPLNPDLNRQDRYARSFESQGSGLGQGYAGTGGTGIQSQDSIRRKGLCSMCGQKSNKKVQCLVCNKKYCERCVGRAMGSMPEGRKCVGCVGLNIDEANRPHLGRSDSTIPGLAKDRTSEILRAELVAVANLAGSERVVVNRKPLTREDMSALMNAERPPPRMERGDFWYDARSGLWGKAGRPFERIVTPGLPIGGPLPQDASGGSTRVYINGRELGKRELRLFKFAGAKLKSNKRIWLDADGAYGEEGGPAKGNMWELKPLQLMLPLFGRPASEVETRLAKELQAEAASRVSKLLLVGAPETGKSTFARVVREMYGSGFSEEEQAGELRAMVLANVLHCARRLLEGRKEKFDDEEGEEDQWKYALEPENEPVAARALTAISTALGIAEMEKGKWLTLDYKLAGDLQRLWCDPGVQATFRVGGDISLPDSTDYFMDRLAEISAPGYVPSWDDVMECQVLHQVIPTGVTQVDFSIDDPEPSALSPTVPFSGNLSAITELENAGFGAPFSAGNAVPSAVFRLLDAGPGHLANSPGWRRACEVFSDVSAVLFFVGLSDFDRFHSVGGEFRNRLEDARDLFESVINSPSFEGKSILLLFNKFDLFCRKLRANTSLTECDWLEDYDPGDHSTASDRFREDVEAQNAYIYIEKKFMALVEERNKRAPQVEVLVYKLSAMQQDSVDTVLQHLPDIVP